MVLPRNQTYFTIQVNQAKYLHTSVPEPDPEVLSDVYITFNRVNNALGMLLSKVAPVPDGIMVVFLKYGGSQMTASL